MYNTRKHEHTILIHAPKIVIQLKRKHKMKIIVIVPVLAALFTANVYAECENSKTVFSCTTTKGKQIEVCDADKTIVYSFGKAQGKPEISIQVPRDQS